MKSYYVYFLASMNNNALYIGVTNDLERRLYEHVNKLIEGFSKKYSTIKLVYYEDYSDINDAINREKQLKGWRREKKNSLINKINPAWRDLSQDWNQ